MAIRTASPASTSVSSFVNIKKPTVTIPRGVGARNGFAQVSIWGNSSAPSIFNTLLNASHTAGIASDPINENGIITPQFGASGDFSPLRPMKAYQRFKNFNLKIGKYFHLQGMGAVSNHHVY